MPAQPALAQPPPQRLSSPTRVEYLDYQSFPDCREYRLTVRAPEGSVEFRFRIPIAAFAAKRMLLQDGPDVCYQKLLRTLAAGETPSPDAVTIDDVELANYREAHTPAPRRAPRSSSPSQRTRWNPTGNAPWARVRGRRPERS